MSLKNVFDLKPKNCVMAALGSAILAFGLYNVHSFSGVTEGGILGLELLFRHWLGISPAISGLIMSALSYIVGIAVLGKGFVGYSVIAGGGYSVFYFIFEQFPPIFPEIAGYPVVAALVGAVFVGVGVGISVRAGGAPCGDDALAMALSRVTGLGIQWIYLIGDVSVLAISLTYIPVGKIVYSLITVVLSGQIVGLFQKKPKETSVGDGMEYVDKTPEKR